MPRLVRMPRTVYMAGAVYAGRVDHLHAWFFGVVALHAAVPTATLYPLGLRIGCGCLLH